MCNRCNKNCFVKSNSKKTAEATGDLFGNKIADNITSVSKKPPKELYSQNEDEKEIPKERYISPEKKTTIY